MALSTDFKDDILNESVNEKRKYNMITNDDGTVSFEDVTEYSQTGSSFGANEVNEEREAINSATQIIGDEDISDIGDGTVTGAIAELNDTFTTRIGNVGISAGTTVVSLSADIIYRRVVTLSDINDIFGVSDSSNNNTAVFVANGDYNANSAIIVGTGYYDNGWHAFFSTNLSGNCRINYFIVRWNLP